MEDKHFLLQLHFHQLTKQINEISMNENQNKLYDQILNQSINEDFPIFHDFLIIDDVFQQILLETN